MTGSDSTAYIGDCHNYAQKDDPTRVASAAGSTEQPVRRISDPKFRRIGATCASTGVVAMAHHGRCKCAEALCSFLWTQVGNRRLSGTDFTMLATASRPLIMGCFPRFSSTSTAGSPTCRPINPVRRRQPVAVASARIAPRRSASSASAETTVPVELSFDVVQPVQTTASEQSLVICHGLFGSKQNWRSLAKAFAQRLGMPVYTLDLRNHGNSPHAEPHTYAAMAADIGAFFDKQGLKSGVNLVGHSMSVFYSADIKLLTMVQGWEGSHGGRTE